MSIISDYQKRLIEDVIFREFSLDEFCRKFPIDPIDASWLGLDLMRQSLKDRDSEGLSLSFFFAFRFGVTPEYFNVLMMLAEEDWHQSHEDVIDALNGIHDSTSIDVVYRTALSKYPYREHDEAYSLGVKCIWMLAGINTPDAVNRLGDILYSGNNILEFNAEQRLIKMATKRTPVSVREAANRILEARGSLQSEDDEPVDISFLLEENRETRIPDQRLLKFLLDGENMNIRSNMNEDQVVEVLGKPQEILKDNDSSYSLKYGNLRIQFVNESITALHLRDEGSNVVVIKNFDSILERFEVPIDLDVLLYELKQLGVQCRLITPLTSDFQVSYKVGKNSEIVYDIIRPEIAQYSTYFRG